MPYSSQQAMHNSSCIFLHARQHMCIDTECYAYIAMPQTLGYDLHWYASKEHERSRRVPKIVETDGRYSCYSCPPDRWHEVPPRHVIRCQTTSNVIAENQVVIRPRLAHCEPFFRL